MSSESSEIAAETAESTAEAATKTPGYRGGGVQSTRVPRRRRPGPIRPPGPNPGAQTASAKTALAGKVPKPGGENQNLVTRPRRSKKWGQHIALSTKMTTRAPGNEQGPNKNLVSGFVLLRCCSLGFPFQVNVCDGPGRCIGFPRQKRPTYGL